MNIKQLLQSTSNLEGYGPESLGTKKFGSVYAYNKTVKVKPKHSIIEISMMIKGVTDFIYDGGSKRPVAAHLIKVAIKNVEFTVVSGIKLVRMIRDTDPKYQDKTAYPSQTLIKNALEGTVKYFKGKTVFKHDMNPKDARKSSKYVIVEDKIKDTNEIRVWCSCSSYYWTFLYSNIKNGVCITTTYPPKYIHKTKKGYEAMKEGSPMRNPNKSPGVCKHILLLLSMLLEGENALIKVSGRVPNNLVREYSKNINKFKKEDLKSNKDYKNLILEYRSDHATKIKQRSVDRLDNTDIGYKERKKRVNKLNPNRNNGKFTKWKKGGKR